MCGLVGVLGLNSVYRVSEQVLIAMRDSMVHRGPDGADLWINETQRVGLGFRRLAIQDLSPTAMQPMHSPDGRYILVFNGEIYNHVALREQLKKEGVHTWRTDHSDTEVIVNAWMHWGPDCVQQFRGMFAIAVWDQREQALYLVRDRLGIKPLYYSAQHGRLVFASEIKALLADPQQGRSVNFSALSHYLSFLVTPAPQTLFDGIHKLPPATILRVENNGAMKQWTYWDVLKQTHSLIDLKSKDLSDLIVDTLRESVRLHQVSDVPVGVFLSGGIDSSTNAVLFAENAPESVRTFSIGYTGDYASYPSELPYARQIANQLKAQHYEKLLSEEDVISFIPRLIMMQDEPIADPVCVPVYYVSELARQNGTIVCQVGEGADELFIGYPTWLVKWKLQRLARIPGFSWSKYLLYQSMRLTPYRTSWASEALRRDLAGQPIFWGGAEAFTHAEKKQLFSGTFMASMGIKDSWEVIEPFWNHFKDNAADQHILQWMSYLDLNYRLPELLLMRVDKMSMATSLEARVPFLDHRFVELAMSLPAALKIQNDKTKYLLKEAVKPLLPSELIHRQKQGFGVPVYEWLNSRWGIISRQVLQSFVRETGWFNVHAIDDLFEKRQASKIWYLLNLALWWRGYIQQEDIQEYLYKF